MTVLLVFFAMGYFYLDIFVLSCRCLLSVGLEVDCNVFVSSSYLMLLGGYFGTDPMKDRSTGAV
jgi:hypothetical protein